MEVFSREMIFPLMLRNQGLPGPSARKLGSQHSIAVDQDDFQTSFMVPREPLKLAASFKYQLIQFIACFDRQLPYISKYFYLAFLWPFSPFTKVPGIFCVQADTVSFFGLVGHGLCT